MSSRRSGNGPPPDAVSAHPFTGPCNAASRLGWVATTLLTLPIAPVRLWSDPAYIHAWRDTGYIVTEENQHMFSAAEVEAFEEGVRRHKGDDPDGDSSPG
jgi:hypothetical protein